MKVPKGMIEDVLIKVRDFFFPVDFIVLETEPMANPRGQIPVILGQPFLATSNALINCRNGLTKLSFGNMTLDLNIFHLGKPNGDEEDHQPIIVNFVQANSEGTPPKLPHPSNFLTPHFNVCPVASDLKLFMEGTFAPTLWREGPLVVGTFGGLGWRAREDINDLLEPHDPV